MFKHNPNGKGRFMGLMEKELMEYTRNGIYLYNL